MLNPDRFSRWGATLGTYASAARDFTVDVVNPAYEGDDDSPAAGNNAGAANCDSDVLMELQSYKEQVASLKLAVQAQEDEIAALVAQKEQLETQAAALPQSSEPALPADLPPVPDFDATLRGPMLALMTALEISQPASATSSTRSTSSSTQLPTSPTGPPLVSLLSTATIAARGAIAMQRRLTAKVQQLEQLREEDKARREEAERTVASLRDTCSNLEQSASSVSVVAPSSRPVSPHGPPGYNGYNDDVVDRLTSQLRDMAARAAAVEEEHSKALEVATQHGAAVAAAALEGQFSDTLKGLQQQLAVEKETVAELLGKVRVLESSAAEATALRAEAEQWKERASVAESAASNLQVACEQMSLAAAAAAAPPPVSSSSPAKSSEGTASDAARIQRLEEMLAERTAALADTESVIDGLNRKLKSALDALENAFTRVVEADTVDRAVVGRAVANYVKLKRTGDDQQAAQILRVLASMLAWDPALCASLGLSESDSKTNGIAKFGSWLMGAALAGGGGASRNLDVEDKNTLSEVWAAWLDAEARASAAE